MEKHKTGEPVKPHLDTEPDTNQADTPNEIDADELIHEENSNTTEIASAKDMDDLVHKIPILETVKEEDEKDPDDLVHGN